MAIKTIGKGTGWKEESYIVVITRTDVKGSSLSIPHKIHIL